MSYYFKNRFAPSKKPIRRLLFAGVMFAFTAFLPVPSSHATEPFGSTPDEGNALSFTREALMNAQGQSGVDYQTNNLSKENIQNMSCGLAYGSLSDFKQMKDAMMQSVHTSFAGKPEELNNDYVVKTAFNAHLIEMSFAYALIQAFTTCLDLITMAPAGSYDGKIQKEAGAIIDAAEKGSCTSAMSESEKLLDKVLREGAADTTPMYQQKSYMTALIAKSAAQHHCVGENWLSKMKAQRDDPKAMAKFSKRLRLMLNAPAK